MQKNLRASLGATSRRLLSDIGSMHSARLSEVSIERMNAEWSKLVVLGVSTCCVVSGGFRSAQLSAEVEWIVPHPEVET